MKLSKMLTGIVISLTTLMLGACSNHSYHATKRVTNKTSKIAKTTITTRSSSVVMTTSESSSKKFASQTQLSSNCSSSQQSWTLESAKDYYLATVTGNVGNPNQLVGDVPTKAQNGPTNWQVMNTSNNGQTMTVGINGDALFTITNNDDGTSTINLGSITMKVRNSDHYILENNQPR